MRSKLRRIPDGQFGKFSQFCMQQQYGHQTTDARTLKERGPTCTTTCSTKALGHILAEAPAPTTLSGLLQVKGKRLSSNAAWRQHHILSGGMQAHTHARLLTFCCGRYAAWQLKCSLSAHSVFWQQRLHARCTRKTMHAHCEANENPLVGVFQTDVTGHEPVAPRHAHLP